MYVIVGILLYTRNLHGTDAGCSFVFPIKKNERTKEMVFKRLHMGSVGSDRFHGEGDRDIYNVHPEEQSDVGISCRLVRD